MAPPGNLATDTLMFVFNTDEEERLTTVVGYTQHKLGQVAIYRIAGNFRGVIFSWISIINHICGGKFMVSESIIANHTCTSLVRG